MTVDDWRVKYEILNAERDAAQKRVQDCETRMMRYAIELAEMQDERDAARAGEARAVEALDVFARAYRVSMLPFAPGIDEADGAHHWMPNGWPSVADFKQANAALTDSSALDWLAQQRREAAQAGEARAVEALRAVVAAVLPHEEDTWIMGAVALRHVHRVLDQYEPTLDNQPSALDWLAQQRAEADGGEEW